MEDNKTEMLYKRSKHSKRMSFDDVNALLQSFAAEVDFVFECDDSGAPPAREARAWTEPHR